MIFKTSENFVQLLNISRQRSNALEELDFHKGLYKEIVITFSNSIGRCERDYGYLKWLKPTWPLSHDEQKAYNELYDENMNLLAAVSDEIDT